MILFYLTLSIINLISAIASPWRWLTIWCAFVSGACLCVFVYKCREAADQYER